MRDHSQLGRGSNVKKLQLYEIWCTKGTHKVLCADLQQTLKIFLVSKWMNEGIMEEKSSSRTGEAKIMGRRWSLSCVLKDVQEFSKWARTVGHTRWLVQTWNIHRSDWPSVKVHVGWWWGVIWLKIVVEAQTIKDRQFYAGNGWEPVSDMEWNIDMLGFVCLFVWKTFLVVAGRLNWRTKNQADEEFLIIIQGKNNE